MEKQKGEASREKQKADNGRGRGKEVEQARDGEKGCQPEGGVDGSSMEAWSPTGGRRGAIGILGIELIAATRNASLLTARKI